MDLRKPTFMILLQIVLAGGIHAHGKTTANPVHRAAPDTSILSTMGRAIDMVTDMEDKLIEWLTPLSFKYSLKLDLPVEELSNFQLLKFIDEWYGVRYRLGGDSKTGIDCSAFTRKLLNEVFCVYVGRVVPDQFKAGFEISRSDLRMGDLVFFKTSNRRVGYTHVGFYLGNNRFVHATVSKGVQIDNLESPYYRNAFRTAVRPHSLSSVK